MCAPKSAGFLYARPGLQPLLEPLVVSWGWQSETPGESPFLDYFEWRGTHDPSAYLAVPAALDYLTEHDWPAVRAACHQLVAEARARIAAIGGLPQICPESMFGQMATAPLPPCDMSELKRRLWDDYQIEVPLTRWGQRHMVRVSIQAYNGPNDVDRLVEALKTLLPETAL